MVRETNGITYTYSPKKIKNINLRVAKDGSVSVSAPVKISLAAVDAFIEEKAQWIKKAQSKQQEKNNNMAAFESIPEEECLRIFQEIITKWLPYTSKYVPQKLSLATKEMKSKWGVCYPAKNKVVINKKLGGMPYALQEYVVLHELVHFKHANHQKEFHDEMQRLMPDYKMRRKALQSFY